MITMTKQCSKCGKNKPLDAFPIRRNRPSGRQSQCKTCKNEYNQTHKAEYRVWCDKNRDHLNEYARRYNHMTGRCKPLEDSEQSPLYLGVHIAETALCGVFKDAKRMPFGTTGYDLLCDGIKVDVKCSVKLALSYNKNRKTYTYNAWKFRIGHNTIADVFALIALDGRDSLNPIHVWLIPGAWLNDKDGVTISDSYDTLLKWKRFEVTLPSLSKEINRVISRCSA